MMGNTDAAFGASSNRSFALAAILGDGPASLELVPHLPSDRAASVTQEIQALLSLPEEERSRTMKGALSHLRLRSGCVGLGVIHPGWILEALSGESPLVIGLVLRYLPAEAVSFILTRMDARMRDTLPSMKLAFRVSQEVIEIVRQALEDRIGPTEPNLARVGEGEAGQVTPFFQWDYRKVEKVISALGVEALALALRGTDAAKVRFFLRRLKSSDSRSLKERIRAHREVDSKLTQLAMIHLLSLDLTEGDPHMIFPEVGLSLLALPFRSSPPELARIFAKRLEPKWGYLFLRYGHASRGLSSRDGDFLVSKLLEGFKG